MGSIEQERAIGSEKKNIVITASAGAGKTHTMICRVLDLVTRRGVPLSSIVMLTFTEAAAEEMKTRLSAALIEEIKAASGQKRELLSAALDQFPFLQCCTIDAFCYRLVKSHFELLGLSPLHTITEDASDDREKALEQVLEEYAERDEEGYFKALASFGKEEENLLKREILKVYDFAETTEDGDLFLLRAEEIASSEPDEMPCVKAFVRKVATQAKNTLQELLSKRIAFPAVTKILQTRYRQITDVLERFSCVKTLKDISLVCDEASVSGNCGNDAKNYPQHYEIYLEVKALYDAFLSGIPLLKGIKSATYPEIEKTIRSSSEETLVLLDLVKRFKKVYHEIKEEERKLDFCDVEHHALSLLRDHGVAAEIDCRYLLVDECQDLNPLQDVLIRHLVGENHLFTVGDVKQSIYRFRLSDPELFYDRVEEGLRDPSGSEVIRFDKNYRSSRAVIDFVNTLFARLMDGSFGGEKYVDTEMGDPRNGEGGVRCFFYRSEEEAPAVSGVYSVKEAAERVRENEKKSTEGEWVRDRILEIVRNGGSFKDVALLSPTRMAPGKVQEEVVNCLREAGIPLNLGDFVREAEYPEIDALVDFLRLIESPHNDYALLSVLRSDLFGFSPERLAEISLLEGDSFSAKAEKAAEEKSDISEFYRYLERMRFLSSSLSLYELVSQIIEDRMRLTVLGRPDGRKVFGELMNFALTLKGGPATDSISEYLPYFDKYFTFAGGGDVEEPDAVSVMTVHASKGRQFPYVFVIGLGESVVNARASSGVVRADKEYGVIKKGSEGSEKNLLLDLFREKKEKELKEDKLRLLYVAMTRAKDSLFLSGELEPNAELVCKENAKKVSSWVLEGMRGKYSYETEYRPLPPAKKETSLPDEEAIDEEVALLERAFAFRYPHEVATKTRIKYTVTSINERVEEEGAYPPTVLFPEEKKAKGTAFHSVMEEIPFSLREEREVSAFLEKMTSEGRISAQDGRYLSPRAVLGALSEVRALVGERQILREKSFLLHVSAKEAGVADIADRVEVQGKIDLLAIGKEDAVIVDYKYSGRTADELMEKYRAQLDLYALAVQKSFGIRKIRKYIFVLGRNETIEL